MQHQKDEIDSIEVRVKMRSNEDPEVVYFLHPQDVYENSADTAAVCAMMGTQRMRDEGQKLKIAALERKLKAERDKNARLLIASQDANTVQALAQECARLKTLNKLFMQGVTRAEQETKQAQQDADERFKAVQEHHEKTVARLSAQLQKEREINVELEARLTLGQRSVPNQLTSVSSSGLQSHRPK